MKKSKNKKYFNRAQRRAMAIAAKDETIVAPRGFGKSEGIDAPRLLRNVHAMPRSAGALLSPTYAKLLQNTLPAVFHALERLGYRRNIHFFYGRKPPKNSGFAKPYIEPFSYDHVISWPNGSIQHLISFDRAMSTNSMSLDYVFGFEAKFLDYNKIMNEVFPANRGNRNYFGECPWHHGTLFTTDMPTLKSGMWVLEKEKEVDEEILAAIQITYNDYIKFKRIPELKRNSYEERKLRELKKILNILRSKASFYYEPTIFDNIEILGEEFIFKMKRSLPPLIFQTAIMNKRLMKIENGFYPSLNEKIHCYTAEPPSHILDAYGYDIDKFKDSCINDGDIEPDVPLAIGLDYNSAISNIITGQGVGREARALKHHFVKNERKLGELIDDWCNYYSAHANRDVIYYYDHTATGTDASSDECFADIVIRKLKLKGWNVEPVYIGQARRHNLKYNDFDLAMKGDPEYLMPTFNKHNCEYLITAMNITGTKQGRNGFEKDKSPEKKADSPEQPDETKTHVTDAWDTLYIGLNYWPVDSINKAGVSTHFSQ
jgi:hypothetical protein